MAGVEFGLVALTVVLSWLPQWMQRQPEAGFVDPPSVLESQEYQNAVMRELRRSARLAVNYNIPSI